MTDGNALRLEVNLRMIPAYLGVMLLASDLFAVSVAFRDFQGSLSLWDLLDNQSRAFYVLTTIVVLAAVMLHLLEMGGPRAFRGKAILTLGTAGLLTGFNNLSLLIGSVGVSRFYYTFLLLTTLFAFAMAITDIVFRSMQNPTSRPRETV